MTEKQFLDSLIKGMKGSKYPVIYGTDLYLQFVESWNNPANEYSEYERGAKNIETVEVNCDWESIDDCCDDVYYVHVNITRANNTKTTIETIVSFNPYERFSKMIREERNRAYR